MRVLVAGEAQQVLREGVERAGHEMSASLSSPLTLFQTIERVQPDVIVIQTDSPDGELLEQLAQVRCPVVMFARDGAPEVIRAAMQAGVAAYVVDGLDPKRMPAIIDVAVARFEEFQRLRLKLSERKLIERAKGVLMKTRGMDEEAAYAFLRKAAMDRKLKLADVAQRFIEASDLLGA